VPADAEVWYYVRADSHEDAESHFDWVRDIADAGAKMSRTKVAVQIDTDCHEIIPNLPLSKVLQRNFKLVGSPRWEKSDLDLARQLQTALREDFGQEERQPLRDKVEELPEKPFSGDGGSTDVGDISWHVPTGGIDTACFAAGSPGHSWQNVAAIGSPIGHKGLLVAAKVLALSAVDLLQDPQALKDARADFQERTKKREYTTKIPKGQKAPRAIR